MTSQYYIFWILLIGLSLPILYQTQNLTTTAPSYSRVTATLSITEKMPSTQFQQQNLLVIDVGKNKTIHLPNNSVTLVANVVGALNTTTYEYDWKLVQKPKKQNAGELDGKNNRELKLSNLILGKYRFNVSVRGNNSFGVGSVFVFVRPAIKKNQPPVAIIKPPFQTVQLPNNIIIDGSSSTDDHKIVSYHWETVQSPIELEKNLKNSDQPLFQLDKNIIAGNYTFKLTVKDAQGLSNFTTASLVVLPEKDYPPKADPGPNMIVNLPLNSAILNGSGSTDDKEIVSYEWSKISDGLTADIQGVREPILRLSNLQEGTYTFKLKVTDSKNQISEKEVKVFVKPRVNVAPIAKAGLSPDKQITIRLPATEATLDGSSSSDDDKIVTYLWEQIPNPQNPELLNLVDGDKSIAHVNKLKVGVFQFKLTVWDIEKQHSSDVLTLHVEESQNQHPKAIVNELHEVYHFENNLVKIDGSKSYDDHKIVKFQWTREDDSLVKSDVLYNSSEKRMLLLTGFSPGIYKFKLTVFDAEGLSDSALTKLIVLHSKLETYLIELQFVCSYITFTEAKKNAFLSSIQLIIQKKIDSDTSRVKINVVKLSQVPFSNSMAMVFYATLEQKIQPSSVPATNSVSVLRTLPLQSPSDNVGMAPQKESSSTNAAPPPLSSINLDSVFVVAALSEARHDYITLTYPLLRIETFVCQNNCSGHGRCNVISRLCECDTFWVGSLIRDKFGDGRPNCDWSVIYLIAIFCFILFLLIGFIWFGVWLRRRKCKSKKVKTVRKSKYMRLSEYDSKYKLDSSIKHQKPLSNGGAGRMFSDPESKKFVYSDSNISSDLEETMFVSNRIGNGPNLSVPATTNGSGGNETIIKSL